MQVTQVKFAATFEQARKCFEKCDALEAFEKYQRSGNMPEAGKLLDIKLPPVRNDHCGCPVYETVAPFPTSDGPKWQIAAHWLEMD